MGGFCNNSSKVLGVPGRVIAMGMERKRVETDFPEVEHCDMNGADIGEN